MKEFLPTSKTEKMATKVTSKLEMVDRLPGDITSTGNDVSFSDYSSNQVVARYKFQKVFSKDDEIGGYEEGMIVLYDNLNKKYTDPARMNTIFENQFTQLKAALDTLPAEAKLYPVEEIYYSLDTAKATRAMLNKKLNSLPNDHFYKARKWAPEGVFTCPTHVASYVNLMGVTEGVSVITKTLGAVCAQYVNAMNYWGKGDNVSSMAKVGLILFNDPKKRGCLTFKAWSGAGKRDYPNPNDLFGVDYFGQPTQGVYYHLGEILRSPPTGSVGKSDSLLFGTALTMRNEAKGVERIEMRVNID
jgi:hypothetical protein